jgi:hypothetical protein
LLFLIALAKRSALLADGMKYLLGRVLITRITGLIEGRG